MSELSLGPSKPKCDHRGHVIVWTDEMLTYLRENYAIQFNRVLTDYLNVGYSALRIKARELGLFKEPGFYEKRKKIITQLSIQAYSHKGLIIPNSESTRFKKGNRPLFLDNPVLHQTMIQNRNATIKSEKLRLRIGLPQKTKLKLNPL